jgi:hypothetical protein
VPPVFILYLVICSKRVPFIAVIPLICHKTVTAQNL